MRGRREPAPLTKPGRTSGEGRRTILCQMTRRPAPVVFSPRFRDAVRRVTERGRSQRNVRGGGGGVFRIRYAAEYPGRPPPEIGPRVKDFRP